MKTTVLFSVLALTASVFADDELVAAAQKMNGRSQQQKNNNNSNQTQMMNVVTLTSARPESDNGWYIFADALYWHADVGSSDWANDVRATVNNHQKTKNHSLDFKWDWGFRVGLGANIDHDMWDTNFYYTWFFTDNSNSAGRSNTSFLAGELGDDFIGVNPNSGSIHWDIHYSMFDWELGRWYYVSKNLALRPHVGIKGGWIDQDIKLKYRNQAGVQGPVSAHQKLENEFWGVGPSVGVNTMWVLGNAGKAMDHRFSLCGDFSGALMYGHFEVEDKYKLFNRGGAQTSSVKRTGLTRNLAAAMLQGFLGLSWDTAFNKGKNHFTLKAGYELQYWFRQNQLVWTDLFSANHRLSDDLALQGVTAEFRFDF